MEKDAVVGLFTEVPFLRYSFDRESCLIKVACEAGMEGHAVLFHWDGVHQGGGLVLSETNAKDESMPKSLQKRGSQILIRPGDKDLDLILQQDEKVDWERVVTSFKEKHPSLKLSAKDVDKIKSLMGVEVESSPGLEMVLADGISEMVMLKYKNEARGMSLTLVAFMFAALLF